MHHQRKLKNVVYNHKNMVLVKCHLISNVNIQHLSNYHNLVDLIRRYPHHLSYLKYFYTNSNVVPPIVLHSVKKQDVVLSRAAPAPKIVISIDK